MRGKTILRQAASSARFFKKNHTTSRCLWQLCLGGRRYSWRWRVASAPPGEPAIPAARWHNPAPFGHGGFPLDMRSITPAYDCPLWSVNESACATLISRQEPAVRLCRRSIMLRYILAATVATAALLGATAAQAGT
ncbi:MAG TPA: hypothetical protein VN201_02675, partial [Roseateles sp.]|nr:hypothetical protein [Roseateles sp.]